MKLGAFVVSTEREGNAKAIMEQRNSMNLTGRYGTQLGIVDWISDEEAAAGLGLPVGAVTWPALMQRGGWKTALIGKWHLGTKPQFHPTKHGYDHFYGLLGPGTAAMAPVFDFADGPKKLVGCTADLVTDDALAFIAANRAQPFMISLHFREPHEPYGPMAMRRCASRRFETPMRRSSRRCAQSRTIGPSRHACAPRRLWRWALALPKSCARCSTIRTRP